MMIMLGTSDGCLAARLVTCRTKIPAPSRSLTTAAALPTETALVEQAAERGNGRVTRAITERSCA
ncbi:hypothetical protein [Amycolatopsis albispora]|uniref:Uncharacterized protein n=1 Tax=Amycolatopsis albispora TaxID=1804986 RepID=A0A344L9R5_9PSEU|nr:hypothetical protein [Amycolatopsis albispora]AXB44789.1 hypothetical protein A4R43_21685 [Amycolatopsis albispora]